MDNMEYADDLKINPEDLDIEWLDQPRKFMKYAELEAEYDREVKRAQEKIKTIRSELIDKATRKPEKCLGKGIKATAQPIEAFYRMDDEYKEAKEDLHDKEANLSHIQNAVRAFHMRKFALENLVKLQMQGYFSAPQEPRNLPEEYSKKGMKEERAIDKTRPSKRNRSAK